MVVSLLFSLPAYITAITYPAACLLQKKETIYCINFLLHCHDTVPPPPQDHTFPIFPFHSQERRKHFLFSSLHIPSAQTPVPPPLPYTPIMNLSSGRHAGLWGLDTVKDTKSWYSSQAGPRQRLSSAMVSNSCGKVLRDSSNSCLTCGRTMLV